MTETCAQDLCLVTEGEAARVSFGATQIPANRRLLHEDQCTGTGVRGRASERAGPREVMCEHTM